MAGNNEFDATKFAEFQQQFMQTMMQQMTLLFQQSLQQQPLSQPQQQQQQQMQQNSVQIPQPQSSQNDDTVSVTSSSISRSSYIPSDDQDLNKKIVLFNLKESYSGYHRNAVDQENVQEILKAMNVSPKIVKITRLGMFRFHDRPRRVLVQFETEEEQQNVLRNASKLKKDQKWKGISMQPFRPKNNVVKIEINNEINVDKKEEPKWETSRNPKKSKKPKSIISPNPFLNFASSDATEVRKEINILVIGETGVGKSTWINGIANYMSFNTFDDALNAKKPVCLIPMNFTLYVGQKYEKVNVNMKPTIGERDQNEAESSTGQSCTQEPKVYRYITDTVTFNLIDTPGIGDTRGVEADMENMKMVLKCLSNWKEIHGICILLKPNVPRLTLSLRYCIEELLVNLHKNSIANIAVIFTNSCSTLFKPGDTMTVLKKLFDDVKDASGNHILLTGANTFCIDNEAVKLLYAHQKGAEFEKDHILNSSRSWIKTIDESYRFFNYATGLSPHLADETKATTQIRGVFIELSKILAEMNEEIVQSSKACKQQIQMVKIMENNLAEKQKPSTFQAEQIQKLPLPYPVTVCCGPNCIETVRIPNSDKQEIFYKKICCRPCPLRTVKHSQIGDPNLRQCTAFGSNGFCQRCGCSWQSHMQIWYIQQKYIGTLSSKTKIEEEEISHLGLQISAKLHYIDQLKFKLQNLQQSYSMISAFTQPYFEFLRQNSIIPLNSALEEYVKFSIEECEKTLKPGKNRDKIENLHNLLAIHQQQKLFITREDQLAVTAAQRLSQKICITNYAEQILSLKNHNIIGTKLEAANVFEDIFETSEFKVVEMISNIEQKKDDLKKETEKKKIPNEKKQKAAK